MRRVSLIRPGRAAGILGLTGLLLAGACWLKDAREQFALRRFTLGLIDPSAPHSAQVQRLTEWLHQATWTTRNPGCFLLASLRATPVQILRDGGDCADKARLLVAMLDTLSIPATSVMLFDVNSGRPCHTVVEAEYAPGRHMVVDPTFGLWFPSEGGGFLGLSDLRAHPEAADVELLRRQSQAPWPARVCFYRRDVLTYVDAASFRWNAGFLSRAAYATLHPLMGEGVYRLRRTAWLERPALTISALIAVITVVASATLALALIRLRQQARSSTRVIRFMPDPSLPSRIAPATKRLLIILAIAAALRFAWLAIAQPTPVSDFKHFHDLAADVLDHGQFGWPEATAYRLPLYPALLAAFMCVSRDILWLSACNVLLSVSLVGAMYALARRLTNDSAVAMTTAACCALNATFVLFSPVLASEHLFALLIVLGWLSLDAKGLRNTLRIPAAGVCLGLACLTRGEGLFWIPVFLFVVWRRCDQRRVAFARGISLILTTMLVLAPWMVRNRIAFGPGIGLSSSTGVSFYFAHNPYRYGYLDLDETPLRGLESTPRHHVAMELSKAHLLAAPLDALLNILRGTAQLYRPSNYGLYWSTGWSPSDPTREAVKDPKGTADARRAGAWLITMVSAASYLAILASAAIGLVLMNGAYRKARRELLLAIGMNWLCYAVVFWATGRYRFLVEVLLCIPASVALVFLRKALVARAGNIALRAGLLTTA